MTDETKEIISMMQELFTDLKGEINDVKSEINDVKSRIDKVENTVHESKPLKKMKLKPVSPKSKILLPELKRHRKMSPTKKSSFLQKGSNLYPKCPMNCTLYQKTWKLSSLTLTL